MKTRLPMLHPYLRYALLGVSLGVVTLGCGTLVGADFNDARPPSVNDAGPRDGSADGGQRDVDVEEAGTAGHVLVSLEESKGGPTQDQDASSPPAPTLVVSLDVFASSPLETLPAGECSGSAGVKSSASPLAAPALTVNVRGPWLPASGLTVDRGSPLDGQRGWVLGGQDYDFSSSGAQDIPGFSRSNVEAPANITITRPEFSSDGALTLDRTVALLPSWTGGRVGRVEVLLMSSEPAASRQAFVRCSFGAQYGKGVVPSKLLALLQRAGDPGITGTYSIRPTNVVEFVEANWNVGIAMSAVAMSGALRVSK